MYVRCFPDYLPQNNRPLSPTTSASVHLREPQYTIVLEKSYKPLKCLLTSLPETLGPGEASLNRKAQQKGLVAFNYGNSRRLPLAAAVFEELSSCPKAKMSTNG